MRYSWAPNSQANMAYSTDLDATMFTHYWFRGTRATHHATPNPSSQQWVEEYTSNATLWVGNSLNIYSIEHTSMSHSSRVLQLQNVLHVPKLTNYLISVKHFTTDNNIFFEFHSFLLWRISTPTKFYLRLGRKLEGIQNSIAFTTSKASLEVWHNCLGLLATITQEPYTIFYVIFQCLSS